eukprot:TRINITY_DN112397_c0_g1_i1.p1 TRINITY_DN112397_c0_g1~~TRINITY_DN112397_c0_g1_i1.p1  ORF type:complete len:525 (-),score=10.41 TRINITY_DN112397_c0_g1_i1:174-1748(-)
MQGVVVLVLISLLGTIHADNYIYETYEQQLKASSMPHGNPFMATVNVTITTSNPQGSRHPHMVFPCFYNGGNTWVFRFEPDTIGTWYWNITSPDVSSLNHRSGSVTVTKGGNSHGGIIRNPKHPQSFIYEDGTPYFLMGYECDWLWALGLEPDTSYIHLESFIKEITSYGFNHILVNVYAKECGWSHAVKRPPRLSPTELTPWNKSANGTLEYETMDLYYWQHFDKVITLLHKYGAIAHVMVTVWNKGVQWPPKLSVADDLYWRYTVARLQGFPNVIFDISKEAWREPKSYWQNRFPYMVALDAHKRMHTSHTTCPVNDLCDFYSLQEHDSSSSPAHHLNQKLIKCLESNPDKPCVNVEWKYEVGPIPTYGHHSTANEMRIVMWSLYMSGGFQAWYYEDTAWDVIIKNVSQGYHYCKTLVDFWQFKKFELYQRNYGLCTNPQPSSQTGMVLEIPGQEYLVYFPGHVDSFELEIPKPALGREYAGRWFNTADGKATPVSGSIKQGKMRWQPPTKNGDVLLDIYTM